MCCVALRLDLIVSESATRQILPHDRLTVQIAGRCKVPWARNSRAPEGDRPGTTRHQPGRSLGQTSYPSLPVPTALVGRDHEVQDRAGRCRAHKPRL